MFLCSFLNHSLCSLSVKKNEIFVVSHLGILHRVEWDGNIKDNFSLSIFSIPFILDLETPLG